MIFDPADGVCPTVEELVLCDLFRNIDLRELRGACVSVMKIFYSGQGLLFAHHKHVSFFWSFSMQPNVT